MLTDAFDVAAHMETDSCAALDHDAHDTFAEPQMGYLCLVHAVHNALGATMNEYFSLDKFNFHANIVKHPTSDIHAFDFIARGMFK